MTVSKNLNVARYSRPDLPDRMRSSSKEDKDSKILSLKLVFLIHQCTLVSTAKSTKHIRRAQRSRKRIYGRKAQALLGCGPVALQTWSTTSRSYSSRLPPGSGAPRVGRGSTPGPPGYRHRQPPSRPGTPSVPRRQPRIQVASLLDDPHVRFYQLEVVQHPIKAAAFEDNVLSRLSLTPPLIVRLTVREPSGNAIIPDDELPFLIAHLSLLDERGLRQVDETISTPGRGFTSSVLYGNLVSVIEQPFEDLQGNMGLFFLFPDVSVRWMGRFQLRISLVRISSVDSLTGAVSLASQGTVLAEAQTRPFDVVHHSQYTAIAQTRLTQSFIRQGARIPPYL